MVGDDSYSSSSMFVGDLFLSSWLNCCGGQCMRRRRRSRRRNLVLCVLLALSSFVEILRGVPLNEFFDGWGSEIASVCLFFFYRFGSVAEIRGGEVSQ